ncbi:MAG: ATP-binding protein [Bacteroidales bacterium]|nr:ATP-binding protein [Bacteroidales bacterium]MCF8338909.1 ATP-binding protein [Bacteroidales bacterium]
MKICSLEIQNNPILGNLYLDFSNEYDEPANSIILAGENGCGKSLILNILYEFSNYSPDTNRKNKGNREKRIFEVTISKKEIDILKNNPSTYSYFQKDIKNQELKIEYDYSKENWNQINVSFTNNENELVSVKPAALYKESNAQIFRSFFSDIGIDYTPRQIQNVTSNDTDQNTGQSERTSAGLATNIAQLLVDIEALDASDYKNWSEKNIAQIKRGIDVAPHLNRRINRFKNAFSYMFENKQLYAFRNENNSKKIYFKEGDYEMPIENLSSGEKQIVFRGGFLLKDQNSLNEEFILIDEPEISLHPTWQLKILQFYKNLFTDIHNNQKSQLFIATHSPFIVHNIEAKDTVIILEKNDDGTIKQKSKNQFFDWKPEVGIKKAFNIDLIFNTTKPIIVTEGKTDKYILKTAWEKLFGDKELPFEIVPSGINEDENKRKGNADQLQRTLDLISNLDRIGKPIIGLFDNDSEGNIKFKGLDKNIFEEYSHYKFIRKHKSKSIYGVLLPVPSHRSKFVTHNDINQRYLEIEHYFDDKVIEEAGLKGQPILDTEVYKIHENIRKAKKMFSEEKVKELDKDKFSSFEVLFKKLKEIIGTE